MKYYLCLSFELHIPLFITNINVQIDLLVLCQYFLWTKVHKFSFIEIKNTENEKVWLYYMICYVMIMYIYAYAVLEIPAGCFMSLDVWKLVACCSSFLFFHCVSKTYIVIYVKNCKKSFYNIFIKHESSFK